MASVVLDSHCRHISNLGDLSQSQRQIEILEVEKIVFIESTNLLKDLGATQHEAATDYGNVRAGLVFGKVMHLESCKPLPEEPLGDSGEESSNYKCLNRGIAFAEILLAAVGILGVGAGQRNVSVTLEKS